MNIYILQSVSPLITQYLPEGSNAHKPVLSRSRCWPFHTHESITGGNKIASRSALLEHQNADCHRRALSSPTPVVKIIKVAAAALVEDIRASKCEGTVGARSEAGGEERAGLGRGIELELEIGGDVAGSSLPIFQNAVVQREGQLVGLVASNHLHRSC